MPSVEVSWTGACQVAKQDELLKYLACLAAKIDDLIALDAELRSGFDSMTWTRRRCVTERSTRPTIEFVNGAISGEIAVDANVFAHDREFKAGAEEIGLPIVETPGAAVGEPPMSYSLNVFAARSTRSVRIGKASLHGINFRVYDPYAWYPGEDRVSFVFLHCPQFLFLDGRVVDAFERTRCPGFVNFSSLGAVDWYLKRPSVHLRDDDLGGWFNAFLAWVKFFFIPGLHWWQWRSLPDYDRHRAHYQDLQRIVGTPQATATVFAALRECFSDDADWRIRDKMAALVDFEAQI